MQAKRVHKLSSAGRAVSTGFRLHSVPAWQNTLQTNKQTNKQPPPQKKKDWENSPNI